MRSRRRALNPKPLLPIAGNDFRTSASTFVEVYSDMLTRRRSGALALVAVIMAVAVLLALPRRPKPLVPLSPSPPPRTASSAATDRAPAEAIHVVRENTAGNGNCGGAGDPTQVDTIIPARRNVRLSDNAAGDDRGDLDVGGGPIVIRQQTPATPTRSSTATTPIASCLDRVGQRTDHLPSRAPARRYQQLRCRRLQRLRLLDVLLHHQGQHGHDPGRRDL